MSSGSLEQISNMIKKNWNIVCCWQKKLKEKQEHGSNPIMCLLEANREMARKACVCPTVNAENILFQLTAILSASVALWASHWCDVPNCCWQEADHVKNNCISTVVSYICYTTLLSVNCGYDTCRVSGVVLAAVAREQLGRSAAAVRTVTFPAGDPEHLNSEGRGKFSFTRDQTAYRLQPPQLATDLGGTPSLWLSRQILKTVPFVGTGLLFLALPVCGCVNKNCHGLIHLNV